MCWYCSYIYICATHTHTLTFPNCKIKLFLERLLESHYDISSLGAFIFLQFFRRSISEATLERMSSLLGSLSILPQREEREPKGINVGIFTSCSKDAIYMSLSHFYMVECVLFIFLLSHDMIHVLFFFGTDDTCSSGW